MKKSKPTKQIKIKCYAPAKCYCYNCFPKKKPLAQYCDCDEPLKSQNKYTPKDECNYCHRKIKPLAKEWICKTCKAICKSTSYRDDCALHEPPTPAKEKILEKIMGICSTCHYTDCQCPTPRPMEETELKRLQKAINTVLNMAEIDSYIFRVHNKGKYSVDAKNGYNECIRDIKRIITNELEGGQVI